MSSLNVANCVKICAQILCSKWKLNKNIANILKLRSDQIAWKTRFLPGEKHTRFEKWLNEHKQPIEIKMLSHINVIEVRKIKTQEIIRSQ